MMAAREYIGTEKVGWTKNRTADEAVSSGNFKVNYYIGDSLIGRVDHYRQRSGLFRVSYKELSDPLEDLVEYHFAKHPGVQCDFWTQKNTDDNGGEFIDVFFYDRSKELSTSPLHLNRVQLL